MVDDELRFSGEEVREGKWAGRVSVRAEEAVELVDFDHGEAAA